MNGSTNAINVPISMDEIIRLDDADKRETGYFFKLGEEIPNTEEDVMDLADKVYEDIEKALGMDMAIDCYYALVEAMDNSCIHGNQGDPNKKIKLTYLRSDKKLLFVVEDEGEGFDVTTLDQKIKRPGPEFYSWTGEFGDRGLSMIFKTMDNVKYNDRGNVIRMEKYIGDN
jgi:anti-sigma regulatory factor (Ser/Thr protein kinase)